MINFLYDNTAYTSNENVNHAPTFMSLFTALLSLAMIVHVCRSCALYCSNQPIHAESILYHQLIHPGLPLYKSMFPNTDNELPILRSLLIIIVLSVNIDAQ